MNDDACSVLRFAVSLLLPSFKSGIILRVAHEIGLNQLLTIKVWSLHANAKVWTVRACSPSAQMLGTRFRRRSCSMTDDDMGASLGFLKLP
eukprot:6173845-Pleurochrysis_carterae.AAC.1